jgi:ATP-dependent Lhr-like helicase
VPGSPEEGTVSARPIRSTPVGLFLREHADVWSTLAARRDETRVSAYARAVLEVLDRRGASFFAELVAGSGLLGTQVEMALGELAAGGLVTSDSFAGLRALLVPSAKRKPINGARRRHRGVAFGVESAGRWSRVVAHEALEPPAALERFARILLRRYGVVFSRLLARESIKVPWRDLLLVYRRLEARGELRGGRFVAGVTGEQFALPDAVASLRAARRAPTTGALVAISAADPLNLVGTVVPGDRVPAVARNRIVFEDGVPVAVLEGGIVRGLTQASPERLAELERALSRRPISSALKGRLGISMRRPRDPAALQRRWKPVETPDT